MRKELTNALSERDDRIDAHRAPSRDKRGGRCHDDQYSRGSGESERIVRLNAIELVCDKPR
jgi:hypothetical protein